MEKKKEIRIQIVHNLSPMHEEIMKTTWEQIVKASQMFWGGKSKKHYEIRVEGLGK